jgi:hypothetical protein
MSEQQIKHGYEELSSDLMPPGDTLDRVTRAVQTRRRRRTAIRTGSALATVVVAGGLAWSLHGGDSDGTNVAVEPPPDPTLVLTRADGSTYAFQDVTVSCTPPRSPSGDPLSSGPGRIWMYSPMRVVDPSVPEDDMKLQQPFLYFEGRVDQIDGKTFTLPFDGPGDSDQRAFTLFAADTEGTPRANEVSSAEVDASGTVTIVKAACDPTPVLQIEVNATLGIEVQEGTAKIAGSYP